MSDAQQIETKVPAKLQLSNSARLKLAEHDFTHHSLTAELGTSLEQVLADDYLAHFANKFKPYDEITVRVDDGTWYARLLVIQVSRAWVKTKVLFSANLSSADVEQSQAAQVAGYEVLWRGPVCKFSVVRKSDKAVLKDQFGTKVAASTWADENA